MKTTPLKVHLVDDELVIRIGFDSLKTSIEYNPRYPFGVTVTDIGSIAEAMAGELTHEEEDGPTPVHRMLDKAFTRAMEYGAEGAEINEETLNEGQ